MNTDAYSLSDSYISVSGGSLSQSFDDFARKTVGAHYVVALALIVVLSVVVIFLVMMGMKETFNPTALMRMQSRDGLGESMDSGKSVFSQLTQSASGGSLVVDHSAQNGQPGSLSWQVLHSKDFDCAGRQSVGDDAWSWMSGVAQESMADKPKSDNDFSRVLAGH